MRKGEAKKKKYKVTMIVLNNRRNSENSLIYLQKYQKTRIRKDRNKNMGTVEQRPSVMHGKIGTAIRSTKIHKATRPNKLVFKQ